MSPECITLKRRRRFGDQLYRKIMKKKAIFHPQGYRISIKTKFRNNIFDNYQMFRDKNEEEKIARNYSLNKFDFSNNNKRWMNSYIKKSVNDENYKNDSLPLINDPRGYSVYNTLGKYNSHFNYNDSPIFPAINSYFH